MSRSMRVLIVALTSFAPALAYAQSPAPAPESMAAMSAAPKTMTKAQKIADAMSAGPSAVARHATIMDWPATPDGQPTQLRAGTNGWVCYPRMIEGSGGPDDPMCLDQQWQAWAQAWATKGQPPKPTTVGMAYMLQGDGGASNTDPFAKAQTADNAWVVSPAHVMLLFPDSAMLDALPTDPKNGGPWVMWKGTPYAHVMVPVSVSRGATVPGSAAKSMTMGKTAPKPAAAAAK